MFFNQNNVRFAEERRKDLQREAEHERLANLTREVQRTSRSEARRKVSKNTSPLWARVWFLF